MIELIFEQLNIIKFILEISISFDYVTVHEVVIFGDSKGFYCQKCYRRCHAAL